MSYAGQFKFSIEMQECKTELDKIILEQFPLVRIHSHNYLTLDYYGVCSYLYLIIADSKINHISSMKYSLKYFKQAQTFRTIFDSRKLDGDRIPIMPQLHVIFL